MMEVERAEASLRIAFQGERGAYGEEAVVAYFGARVIPVPKKSFAEAVGAVVSGETNAGLLPIENSQAGSINEVYDLLRSSHLFVTGEICRPINHCLLCLPGQTLRQIKRVLSHPQALAQCDAYLRGLDVEVVAAYDTAGSAKLIREQAMEGVAAVASARAADLYQLEVLANGIQTIQNNYTRFIVLERQPGEAPGGQAKTMLMLATAHKPGALHQALGEFAARDINLLKLESRPSREQPWEYVFYLDIEGSLHQTSVAQALAALKDKTTFVQVLGTFPRDPAC
ncbi:MAG TPA: prephenate dehydratase [Ktedonobacterales bacterium]|jgi:prephenate dehydratase/chorismate mutase/prephenate dehydratase